MIILLRVLNKVLGLYIGATFEIEKEDVPKEKYSFDHFSLHLRARPIGWVLLSYFRSRSHSHYKREKVFHLLFLSFLDKMKALSFQKIDRKWLSHLYDVLPYNFRIRRNVC